MVCTGSGWWNLKTQEEKDQWNAKKTESAGAKGKPVAERGGSKGASAAKKTESAGAKGKPVAERGGSKGNRNSPFGRELLGGSAPERFVWLFKQ